MEFIDNVNTVLKDELEKSIKPQSVINVATAVFL